MLEIDLMAKFSSKVYINTQTLYTVHTPLCTTLQTFPSLEEIKNMEIKLQLSKAKLFNRKSLMQFMYCYSNNSCASVLLNIK